MRLTLVLSLAGLAGMAYAQAPAATPATNGPVPQMTTVSPNSAKIGSVLKIKGVHLNAASVEEVYLSDQTFDLKVKVLTQTDDSIEFRVPPFVKPGRLQLVVKTTDKDPVLLEQPVYITIEEGKGSTQVAKAQR